MNPTPYSYVLVTRRCTIDESFLTDSARGRISWATAIGRCPNTTISTDIVQSGGRGRDQLAVSLPQWESSWLRWVRSWEHNDWRGWTPRRSRRRWIIVVIMHCELDPLQWLYEYKLLTNPNNNTYSRRFSQWWGFTFVFTFVEISRKQLQKTFLDEKEDKKQIKSFRIVAVISNWIQMHA